MKSHPHPLQPPRSFFSFHCCGKSCRRRIFLTQDGLTKSGKEKTAKMKFEDQSGEGVGGVGRRVVCVCALGGSLLNATAGFKPLSPPFSAATERVCPLVETCSDKGQTAPPPPPSLPAILFPDFSSFFLKGECSCVVVKD